MVNNLYYLIDIYNQNNVLIKENFYITIIHKTYYYINSNLINK